MILTYTGKECKVSPYSDGYEYIQHIPVVIRGTASTFLVIRQKCYPHFQQSPMDEQQIGSHLSEPKIYESSFH